MFANDSQAASLLGIESLKEETSQSVSLGLTCKTGDFTITVDAYHITIDDRIVLSGKFTDGGDPVLESIFRAAGAGKAAIFSKCCRYLKIKGLILLLGYKLDAFKDFKLDNSLAATFSETEITNINVPVLIANGGISGDFFDGQEEAFLNYCSAED